MEHARTMWRWLFVIDVWFKMGIALQQNSIFWYCIRNKHSGIASFVIQDLRMLFSVETPKGEPQDVSSKLKCAVFLKITNKKTLLSSLLSRTQKTSHSEANILVSKHQKICCHVHFENVGYVNQCNLIYVNHQHQRFMKLTVLHVI